MAPRVLAPGMPVGARPFHPLLAAAQVTCLSPAGTGMARRRAGCPIPQCLVPVGAPCQSGCPASPICPCAPTVSPVLGPCAGSCVVAAQPGEGPCRRLPCGAGIHQLRGSGSIYNQEALVCQRATLGCAGRGRSVPWPTRADASAATAGVAGLWGPPALCGVLLQHCRGWPWRVELWGPRSVTRHPPPSTYMSPMPWDTPVLQGPRGSARLGAGGGRAAVPAGAGGLRSYLR